MNGPVTSSQLQTIIDQLTTLKTQAVAFEKGPVTPTVPPAAATLIAPGAFGIMHTQSPTQTFGAADLNAVAPIQGVFASSFGAGDPMQRDDGQYQWDQIDWSVNRAKGASTPVGVIGMWPGWMTGASGTFADKANERRPLEQHIGKAAAFAAAFAQRYAWIKLFAIHSELKGFWDSTRNTWDLEAYLRLYTACRDAILAVRPEAKFIGPYIVLEFDVTRDNNISSTWCGPGWVGDERTLQTTLEFLRRAKPDVIGLDFAPRVTVAGFDPLFKFTDLLNEKGFRQPILVLETYVNGNPVLWVQALKRARTYPQGFGLMAWDEAGKNPPLTAELASQIKLA